MTIADELLGIAARVDATMPPDRFAFAWPDGRRREFWTCCMAETSGPHAASCYRRPRLALVGDQGAPR